MKVEMIVKLDINTKRKSFMTYWDGIEARKKTASTKYFSNFGEANFYLQCHPEQLSADTNMQYLHAFIEGSSAFYGAKIGNITTGNIEPPIEGFVPGQLYKVYHLKIVYKPIERPGYLPAFCRDPETCIIFNVPPGITLNEMHERDTDDATEGYYETELSAGISDQGDVCIKGAPIKIEPAIQEYTDIMPFIDQAAQKSIERVRSTILCASTLFSKEKTKEKAKPDLDIPEKKM